MPELKMLKQTPLLNNPSKQSAQRPMDVFRAIEERDRRKITELVMQRDVSLGLPCSSTGSSLMYCLLKQVCNGDKLVKQKLDSSISTTCQDVDSEDFAVVVDHSKLLMEEDQRNLMVIEDLLRMPRRVCRTVLHHPVILTYIQNRWKNTRWTFLVSFLLYLLFVILYSSFLGMMYWRHQEQVERIPVKFPSDCRREIEVAAPPRSKSSDGDVSLRSGFSDKPVVFLEDSPPGIEFEFEVVKKKKNRTRSRVENRIGLFEGCFKSKLNSCKRPGQRCTDMGLCITEILLVLSIILLVIQELWQCVALRTQYFKELENWFELVILSFAVSTLCFKQDLDNLKVVAALGICLTWLELVFLFGRYPFLGGMFSIMYYTATKRIIKTALGFFVLILGFSFAFFVINFGNESESFDTVFQSFLKVLVMVLGEFEFDDLYQASSSNDLTLTFSMVLLLGMIVFGTIVMVNLIVAIIITDIDWLNEMSKEQVLRNQAHHILQINSLLSVFSCLGNRIGAKSSSSDLHLEFCIHNVCNCNKPRLPKDTKKSVLEIIKMS